MNQDNDREREVLRLISLSEDELLLELGAAIQDGDFHGVFDKKIQALEWMQAKSGVIKVAVCQPDRWPALKRNLDSTSYDDAFLAAVDGWLAAHLAGVPVLTVGALLVKQGLDRLCGEDVGNPDD